MKKSDVKSIVSSLKTSNKNIVGIKDDDQLPAEIVKQLEDKIPPWLQELEADGSAVIRWSFEYAILLEYLLQRDFNFTEEEIDKLNTKLKEMLPNIQKLKVEIPRLLSKQDFHIVREMVERNKKLYKFEKAGITLPNPQEKKELK